MFCNECVTLIMKKNDNQAKVKRMDLPKGLQKVSLDPWRFSPVSEGLGWRGATCRGHLAEG